MSEQTTPELSSSPSDEWTLIDTSEAEMEAVGSQMYSDDIGMSLIEGIQNDFTIDPTKDQREPEKEDDLTTSSPDPYVQSLLAEVDTLNKKLQDQKIMIQLQDKENAALSRQLSKKQHELEEVEQRYDDELAVVHLEKDQVSSEKREAITKVTQLEARLREEHKLAEKLASLKDQEQESLDMAQEIQAALERRTSNLRSALISTIVQLKEYVSVVEEETSTAADTTLGVEGRYGSGFERDMDGLEEEDLSLRDDEEIEAQSQELFGRLMEGVELMRTNMQTLKEEKRMMEEEKEKETGRKRGRRGGRGRVGRRTEDGDEGEKVGSSRRREGGRPNSKETEEGEDGDDDLSNLKISTRNFESGDVMIFFPLYNNYVAFNISCPHHYLSHDSKSMIGSHPLFKKSFIVGRLVIKETYTASSDFNPFDLREGCEFSIVTVTTL